MNSLFKVVNSTIYCASRHLSIHEYQSMSLLKKYGISVPEGNVAFSSDEAFEVAKNLECRDFVVKAQVLAGGRGKGHFVEGFKGGVHVTFSPDSVKSLSNKMIGKHLITKQTGNKGLPCSCVFVSERLYPRREYYIAFTLDRKTNGPLLIGSCSGGMDIEETSATSPELIHTLPIDISKGLTTKSVKEFLQLINFTPTYIEEACKQLFNMYKMFSSIDCTLLEINPFCETNEGKVVSMDCKIQLDDNSLFRHENLSNLRDFTQENELDVLAAKSDINYIGLDGSIGCLVNGAGLAMATMDIIKFHGGIPANFLDIGGGATAQQVLTAFNIITSDSKVRAILVNIFGGIMRCDVIAQGIIEAAKDLKLSIPLVVRLQGTKVEEARMLFANSALRILAIDDLDHAAKMAVKLATIVELAEEANINVKFELPI